MQGECFNFLNIWWNFRPQKGFRGEKSKRWEKIDKFPAWNGRSRDILSADGRPTHLREREKGGNEMMQSLLVLALVGVLGLGLTSCGMGKKEPQNPVTGNSAVTENGPYDDGVNDNRNDMAPGDLNDDAVGNADAYTNDNANTRARRSTLNTPNIHRSAYDYLNDGRYRASSDGNIVARKDNAVTDLTKGARDLIRDAGDMVKDAGRDAGDAARDVGRAAEKTLRDLTR